MQAIASRNLRDLQPLDQHVAIQHKPQFGRFTHFFLQDFGLESQAGARNLHNASVRPAMNTNRQRRPDNSLASHDGNLNAVAIASQNYQRGQTFVEKISKFNFARRLRAGSDGAASCTGSKCGRRRLYSTSGIELRI